MSVRVSYDKAAFDCGDRVLYRHDYSPTESWGIGIITDLFRAPISGQFVYVINGEGFYEHELTADIERPAEVGMYRYLNPNRRS